MSTDQRHTSRHVKTSLGFTLAALMALASNANPHIYRNDEFGIMLPVPERTLLCAFPPQHDHGPVLMLGAANNQACFDLQRNRAIVIFASYNASDETKKLLDFLSWECTEIAKHPCGLPPERLRIKERVSAAARVDRGDGWTDIFVVTQAGRPDPAFDPSVPSINYDLSLRTTVGHLDEDLRVFRTVLATVRLSPRAKSFPAGSAR
jgi:hypothetical protein